MAEIFNFHVQDNRSILFPKNNLLEPIMQEDKDVATWRFRIPKVLNEIDMSGWAWWFVYVNARRQKFSELLTLSNDIDDPENFCTADYSIGYGISKTPGGFTFALESINASQGGEISGEWHTRTYTHTVTPTLQGNQAEYAETESDVISALMQEVRNKVNQLVGGATPLPVSLKSLMTDHDKVYLYTGSETGESTGYWYYWNGTQFVPGGLYGAGFTDSVPTQGSNNAVSSGGVYDALAGIKSDLDPIIIAGGSWNLVDGLTALERTYIRGETTAINQNDFYSYEKIPCKPSTTYYLFCEKLNDAPTTAKYGARFATFFDENENIIGSYVNYPLTTILSPAGAAYVSISFVYKTSATSSTAGVKGIHYFTETASNERNNSTVLNPHALIGYDDIRKGYNDNVRLPCINFQFDDGTAKDADIVTIFNNFGLKCGFALISDISAENVSRYLSYQRDGFEMLCHSTDSTGMNDATISPETIETKLKMSKETLENYGFKIKGFVTPSSTMADVFKPILRKYYQWAETVYYGGYTGNSTPYMLPNDGCYNGKRVSLQLTTLANQKAAVDAAIEGYGCLTFYGHAAALDTTDNLTTQNLTELLTYILAKVNDGLCVVGTPSGVIRAYFAVRNDDVLHSWETASYLDAGLDPRFTATEWKMSFNQRLGLCSFAVRVKALEDVTGSINPLFTFSKPVESDVVVASETGRNCITYNNGLLIQGNNTWTAGTNYRFSGMVRLL